MYKKILVATDLISSEDNPVLNRANEMSQFYNAELHVIHVVERIYTYGTPPFPQDFVEWQKEFVKVAEAKLQKLCHSLGVLPDNQHVPVGNPKELVIEKANEIGVDLIVLGSHSRKGLSYLLLGSTADGVVHASNRDVLVVRVKP
ncbi:MAG: hypothetical protein K940chlam3_01604 [Chlamydiae bacterium]|nr:hypothetical protein [Chlamydiota bacterium]